MTGTALLASSPPAGPPAQGHSASRIASDDRGDTRVFPGIGIFGRLDRLRCRRDVAAPCGGRARPHRPPSHRGRRRFSGQTRGGRYSWARYYHPGLQRFISEDPLEFNAGDPNLYAYVLNTPVNYSDPSGEVAPVIAAGVACGAGAVGGVAVVLSGRKPTLNQIVAGAGIGCAGGLAVLGAWTAAGVGAASAAVWPVVPGAVDKLGALATRFAISADRILSAAAQSNARFLDTLAKNSGNVNIFLPRPDRAAGFIRVTLDPTQSRIISAGLMRAGQVGQGIVNGRFIPLE